MAEWIWNFTFEQHSETKRKHVEQPTQIEAHDLQRHQCFIQAPFSFDELAEADDVAGPPHVGQTLLDRRPSEPDNGFHGFHIFRADLYAEVAARAIPETMIVLKRREPRTLRK